ncbi:hypothetical protein EVAR_42895_1 [Eumeta japonica]|uniref:Uncharacterized protein n=1 Tax=Eumeta variegata TaxID=151549 RepID=A0A4C1WXF0_EUMVA|nr:hypothetical protein EVAR_42895_1 [Eumeta japonica]
MHETAAVKLVTKASQRRKVGMRGRRRQGREALNICNVLFARDSERQSFVHCTIHYTIHIYRSKTLLGFAAIRITQLLSSRQSHDLVSGTCDHESDTGQQEPEPVEDRGAAPQYRGLDA